MSRAAEILLKISGVPAFPIAPLFLEIEPGTAPTKASLENHPEHPGTSKEEIMTWVDRVNELLIEANCLSVAPEMALVTRPLNSVELKEGAAIHVEEDKRAASECEETIVVEVPEPKKRGKPRAL
jgi:hypothetical protein